MKILTVKQFYPLLKTLPILAWKKTTSRDKYVRDQAKVGLALLTTVVQPKIDEQTSWAHNILKTYFSSTFKLTFKPKYLKDEVKMKTSGDVSPVSSSAGIRSQGNTPRNMKQLTMEERKYSAKNFLSKSPRILDEPFSEPRSANITPDGISQTSASNASMTQQTKPKLPPRNYSMKDMHKPNMKQLKSTAFSNSYSVKKK